MILPADPANEAERLSALETHGILDTGGEPAFDSIARAASLICGTPIAAVSLVDRSRQWFKSTYGLPAAIETSRDVAFCAHTILARDMLEVGDATEDPRFRDNPLVLGEAGIRF